MKKLYLYLALAIPFISMMSCSQNDKAKADGTIADTTAVEEKQQKTSSDSAKTTASKPEAVNKLTGTQSELDFMKNSGNWPKYQSGILPQMAEDAPEYCGKILQSGKKHFVIVDKGKMHVFLYDQFGNIIKKYPLACAKNYGNKKLKGDSRTTEGYFPAEGVYDSRNWKFTNDRGYTSPAKGVFGPWFIRVKGPIGIHGTSAPGSIGRRCSHGCIRVNNEHIKELIQYVDKGTPIIVSPGPKDMAVNAKEGTPTLAVVTEPGTAKATPGSFSMESKSSVASTKSTKKKESGEVASKDKAKVKDSKSSTASAKEETEISKPKADEAKDQNKSTETKKESEPAKSGESSKSSKSSESAKQSGSASEASN